MSPRLPDAAPANWVDHFAPPGLRPWLRLGRFDRPTGIWLLMLPGWQGIALADAMAGQAPEPRLLTVFALGAALMRAAGCAYNDIVDRDIDGLVARTADRPVASGQISVPRAWGFVAGCAAASLVLLVSLNILSFLLGVASLALVAAYPFMKRLTWWPQAWLGLTFNWGALLGCAAAMGGPAAATLLALVLGGTAEGSSVTLAVPSLPAPALVLYASGVLWTLGYDTIYAIQDLEDDALAGVKSSARRLGVYAPAAVAVFYALSATLAVATWRGARLGPYALPFLALFAGHLIWQSLRVRTDDGALALRLFRSNGLAGLLLFAALAAGAWRV